MLSNVSTKGTSRKLGGDVADGQWVYATAVPFSSIQWSAVGNKNVTLSNYLPEDNKLYEILISGWNITGSASSNRSYWQVGCDGKYYQYMGYAYTRTASSVMSGHSSILPVIQKNGVITFNILVNSYSSGSNAGLQIRGYRKVGTNE